MNGLIKQRLKCTLFRRSYLGLTSTVPPFVILEVAVCCLRHVKIRLIDLIDKLVNS